MHRYRKFKKTRTQERSERITQLAGQLGLPRAALAGHAELAYLTQETVQPLTVVPFRDPDPYREVEFSSALLAKRAIAQALCRPLAKLSEAERAFIDSVLTETLSKKAVLERVRRYFVDDSPGGLHAD